MDISVNDSIASITGWVFGTYVWMVPTTGDGLFDNLVPASYDQGVMTDQIRRVG